MKQILQSHQTGKTEVVELPVPAVKRGQVLIRTRMTLISSGTERMLVQASRKGLLQQAIEQPQRVKKAFDRIQSDGLLATVDSVRARSEQMQSLGYCNVGEVIEVGEGVHEFKPGDHVVSNGPHAEYVCVGKNLCAKIPEGVNDQDAVFTVLGAIALQGVRLLAPTLGESFAVMGLGSIGLLAVQILRAHGCRVLAMDFNQERLSIAARMGAETVVLGANEDPLRAAQEFSKNLGMDGVLITASTDSNEPLHQAAGMCRRKGRIVLTGVVGPEFSRADFFEKEISFQVSCSYGPGRYDPAYELEGRDYPLPYVRWTEQRNFDAFLTLISEGKLSAAQFISHTFPVEEAHSAYSLLDSSSAGLGIALTYSQSNTHAERCIELVPAGHSVQAAPGTSPVISFIGAGNYGAQVLLPAFKRSGARIHSVADRGGLLSWLAGKKNGAHQVTTDLKQALIDSSSNVVVIATRHDSHAELACQALEAGKHVFVEKPLAINETQLQNIETAYEKAARSSAPSLLMVGFNRRFSPHVQKAQQFLRTRKEPLSMIITVNAGMIPADHWTHDPVFGGGRIVGEACHFIDLMRYLAASEICRIEVLPMGRSNATRDKVGILLGFADGSIGTLNYLANGHASYPKEHVEIFCAGSIFKIENFVRMRAYGTKTFRTMRTWRQDKGQNACAAAFINAIRMGGPSPIPAAELFEVARATFKIKDQLK